MEDEWKSMEALGEFVYVCVFAQFTVLWGHKTFRTLVGILLMRKGNKCFSVRTWFNTGFRLGVMVR